MIRKHHLFLLLLAFFVLSGSAPLPSGGDDQDYYARLKKSWEEMQNVFEKINLHYVEEIDPYPLVHAAIDGMLDKLDPYTVYRRRR